MAAAALPEEAVAGLAAVCLHPLRNKPSGVRPVGAGEALRRVVARALLREAAGPLAVRPTILPVLKSRSTHGIRTKSPNSPPAP